MSGHPEVLPPSVPPTLPQQPPSALNREFSSDDLAAASKFARSVGGIEQAEALLRHLRSAKDLSPLHREGL